MLIKFSGPARCGKTYEAVKCLIKRMTIDPPNESYCVDRALVLGPDTLHLKENVVPLIEDKIEELVGDDNWQPYTHQHQTIVFIFQRRAKIINFGTYMTHIGQIDQYPLVLADDCTQADFGEDISGGWTRIVTSPVGGK